MPANVSPQPTPNPNAMKFSVDRPVIAGPSKTFASPEEATTDPLVEKIFGVPGVRQVFLLGSFVTVTKQTDATWHDVAPKVELIIREHYD